MIPVIYLEFAPHLTPQLLHSLSLIWIALIEDHTGVVLSNRTIYIAVTPLKTNLKPLHHTAKYSCRVSRSSVHLVFETSFPLGLSPPVLLEIMLLQLHWNRTKKHLVVNGAANLHMFALCGWEHLTSRLRSSSPDPCTISAVKQPLYSLCWSCRLTVLMLDGSTRICN